jgi:hypothetical protein
VGSSAVANTTEDDFRTRLVMAMAAEMSEMQERWKQIFVQFETLATSYGVKVEVLT